MFEALKENLEDSLGDLQLEIATLARDGKRPHSALYSLESRLKQAALCCETLIRHGESSEPPAPSTESSDGSDTTESE